VPRELDYIDGLRAHFAIERILSSEESYFLYRVYEHFDFLSFSFGIYDDGCGNYVRCVWSKDWALLLGFDHESEMSPYAADDVEGRPDVSPEMLAQLGYGGEGWDGVWKGVLEGIPEELRWVAHFCTSDDEMRAITFASWRDEERRWHDAEPVDAPCDGGRAELLSCVAPEPELIRKQWLEYAEIVVPEDLVHAALRAPGIKESQLPEAFMAREDAQARLQRLQVGGVWISSLPERRP
jgi:hypothetical protein